MGLMKMTKLVIRTNVWETLAKVVEGSRGERYVVGDFNGRVGEKD